MFCLPISSIRGGHNTVLRILVEQIVSTVQSRGLAVARVGGGLNPLWNC
jgi:hypothetical protein